MQDDPSKSTLQTVRPKGFPDLPEGWTSEWETFPSSDGALQLFGVMHRREGAKGARVLVVLHGHGEHGGRYLHFPHFLADSVDAVYCLDHRGHGRSEGLRGHVSKFDLFADDVALAVHRVFEQTKKRFGKAHIHLFGHSMGGLIALQTVFRHPNLPLQSVSASAPLLGLKLKVPVAKRAAAKVLTKVWGTIQMKNEVDPNALSHDPEVVKAYVTDRLVHDKVTPSFFSSLVDTMADTMRRDSGLKHPLLIQSPMQDAVVDPEKAIRFFRSLKHRDKELKTYPGFFHEPFNEVGKEECFKDLAEWIKKHSSLS